MKKALLMLFCVATTVSAYCQGLSDDQISQWGKSKSYVENIIPLAPNAAQAIKYADVPVSYNLGLVDVSVDLYQIKSRELSMPLSLSYHASGIRVDDIAGVAGLGWNLNAGGVVTREVVFMPDEVKKKQGLTSDFFQMISPTALRNALTPNKEDVTAVTFIREVAQGRRDAGYDRYSYNFCGHSGSFIIDRANANTIKQIQVNDFKIIPAADLSSFTIITNDGTKYNFTVQEKVSKHRAEAGSLGGVSTDYYVTNAWHLSSVESFNGTDKIRLIYRNENPVWKKKVSSTTSNFSMTIEGPNVLPLEMGTPSRSTTEYSYKPVVVSRIEFANGTVELDYDSESERIQHTASTMADECYNFPWKLRSIVVKNSDGNVIKRAEFSMGRFGYDKRISLDALSIYSGTVLDDKYRFTYYKPAASVSRFSQDFFGYLNDRTDNLSLNPVQDYLDFFTKKFERRRYSFDHAKTFSLTEINHNNVITEFEYEPNSYTDSEWGAINIGLRVKSVNTYNNSNGRKLVKSRLLTYSNAQSTIDFSKVDKSFYVSRGLSSGIKGTTIKVYTLSLSVLEHSGAPGAAPESARICYDNVTEIITDGANRVKMDYVYDCQYDRNEYVSTVASMSKRTDIPTLDKTGFSTMDGRSTGYVGEITGYFKDRPQFFCDLKRKTTYETTASGTYRKVSETINKHHRYTSENVLTDFFARQITPASGGEAGVNPGGGDTGATGGGTGSGGLVEYEDPTLNARNEADFYYFYVYSDAANSSRVFETEQIDYLSSGTKRALKKFKYDTYWWWSGRNYANINDGSLEVIEQDGPTSFKSSMLSQEDDFSGDISYRKKNLFPEDYSSIAPYDQMLARNNVSASLGQEFSKRKKIGIYAPEAVYTKGKYIQYSTFTPESTALILPSKIILKNGGNTVWEQTLTNYDEHGNIRETQELNQPQICYLWGYNYAYPVAEIRNASYAQVAQALGGASAVQQIAAAENLTDSQWAQLKSLRTALPNAAVTIYRHIPLVGLSDVTDPSGREIHYKYDNAWRLKLVCDDAGEPVESYEYFKKISVL